MTDFLNAAGVHLIPTGFQQITSVATAFFLTLPAAGANYAFIQCDTAAFRWRDDGTAPTTSIGVSIAAAGSIFYAGNLAGIQLISTTGTGAANVSYYRGP